MHQTTVRFGLDLWDALDAECARLGVSVAQYLREAALARLVYTAGRRGDDEFELALDLVSEDRAAERADRDWPVGVPARAEPPGSSALWSPARRPRERTADAREEVAGRDDGREGAPGRES